MMPPTPHPAALDPALLLRDCTLTRNRRGGPGGQRRNKVETAILLTHRPTGLRAEASERRSPAQNQSAALFRLRLLLALEIRIPRNLAAPPSALWHSRTSGGKISVNPEHTDFPALLAEALDVITAANFDIKSAAVYFAATVTQLTKFLALEPRAMQRINAERSQRNLHPLRQ